MDLPQTLALIIILVQVIFLEVVLSLDNAAVLGTIVLGLPVDKPVPWPRALKALGHLLAPLLGKQRTAGLRVGLLGAYMGQALMLIMASYIIHNTWLQLVGAAYLLKMSTGTLGAAEEDSEKEEGDSKEVKHVHQRGFWATVLMVELMDLAFSLDNVVVVVSLSNELWLVMFGVAIGIVVMRFAAGLFSKLIEKVPPLATAAYILVFNIGVEFILSRLLNINIPDFTRFIINVSTLALALVYVKIPLLQVVLKTPFKFFRLFFFALDRVFSVVLYPFGWILNKFTGYVKWMFKYILATIEAGD